ncbi:MAG: hypothetical protein GXW85_03645 [Clostridia bacterium]|nr:hypothetical protein [Clostridia bacterium]
MALVWPKVKVTKIDGENKEKFSLENKEDNIAEEEKNRKKEISERPVYNKEIKEPVETGKKTKLLKPIYAKLYRSYIKNLLK